MATSTKVFSIVAGPCSRRSPGGVSPPATNFTRAPRAATATAAIAALRQTNGDAELLQSGLATPGAGGELGLAEALEQLDGKILPLRHKPQAAPYELLCDEGALSGHLPLAAALADHAIVSALAQHELLFLCFSLCDMAALRAVGLPAAPALGLESITLEVVDELRAACGPAGGPGGLAALPDAGPAKVALPPLVLVGWSLAELSDHRPADLDRVAAQLKDKSSWLGLEPEEVLLGAPPSQKSARSAMSWKVAEGTR